MISITNSSRIFKSNPEVVRLSFWHWQPAHRCVYVNHSHRDNQQVYCWYDDEIAYFTVRWKTRKLVLSTTPKNMK